MDIGESQQATPIHFPTWKVQQHPIYIFVTYEEAVSKETSFTFWYHHKVSFSHCHPFRQLCGTVQ